MQKKEIVYSSAMDREQAQELKKLLATPKKIAIIPHKSPDGDAMGSTLGLWHFLKDLGHSARVISPNGYPEFLKWLPGDSEVVNYETDPQKAQELIGEAHLIFTLDFNTLSRASGLAPSLRSSKANFVMIDHHEAPDDYAQFTYSVPSASSTCELVYNFIVQLANTDAISPNIATCLYTGIMTDTGSFRFASTSSSTLRITAELMDKGADNAAIHQAVFDSYSPSQIKLLGTALNNLKVFEAQRAAYITLSQEELDSHHFKKGDTEGFVNYGLALKNIVFAAIFIENKVDGIIKVSLRSKRSFDVNAIARKYFNGGGHINAAGGLSTKSLKETALYFESIIEAYKHELKKV